MKFLETCFQQEDLPQILENLRSTENTTQFVLILRYNMENSVIDIYDGTMLDISVDTNNKEQDDNSDDNSIYYGMIYEAKNNIESALYELNKTLGILQDI
jgi:hypothetical protein